MPINLIIFIVLGFAVAAIVMLVLTNRDEKREIRR
jgi:hypothetical protein